MFNTEYVGAVMDTYQCNQLVVNRQGQVFALAPHGQIEIPGMSFDTHTADGTLCSKAIATAKASSDAEIAGN